MGNDEITIYDVGDSARLSFPFRDVNGAPVDPTDLSVTIRKPDGTLTTEQYNPGSIVKDSVGNYHLDIAVDQEGDWFYTVAGTGAATAVGTRAFYAWAPWTTAGGPLSSEAFTTLGAAREFVLRDIADASQDRKLVKLIVAYSRAVAKYTQREWLPRTAGAQRVFSYDGSGFLSLAPYEARVINSVTMYSDLPTSQRVVLVPGSSTVEGDYRLLPANQTAEGTYHWLILPTYGTSSAWPMPVYIDGDYVRGSFGGYSQVTVNADWGVAATVADIPEDVQLAVLIAVKNAFENPVGYASSSFGAATFVEPADVLEGPEARALNLPREARAMLSPYKRGKTIAVA